MATIRRFLRWCGIHVHEWSEWNSLGELVRTNGGGTIGEVQTSECKICHKRRINRIWY